MHGERTAVDIPYLARLYSLPVLEFCVSYPQPAGILLMFFPRGLLVLNNPTRHACGQPHASLNAASLSHTSRQDATVAMEPKNVVEYITVHHVYKWNRYNYK
jgi:hypothetical protein